MRRVDPTIRIAVTGMGIVCSIGRNRAEVWRSIVESRDGIGSLSRFPGETFPTTVAAEVAVEPSLPVARRDARRLSRTDRLAVAAAAEAIAQASEITPLPLQRAVVATGTSTGGLLEGEEFFISHQAFGRAKASKLIQQPTSSPSDAVARATGAGGGVLSNATACASASGAIGSAADYLRSGHADVAIAGGSDALCRLTYSGFNVLQAVDPAPCTPFSAARQGITLGEGAAYLVLERWDDAIRRGATILAEFLSYGASCDAHHATAPAEDGRGAEAAMKVALENSAVSAVDYVNAHGTGTLLNDSAETRAIEKAVGAATPVSSTKSYFGHTLGASGALEAVISVLALREQVAPPTLRLKEAAADCRLDYIPGSPRPMAMETVLSNTFGFGGSNVSLVFRRVSA